MSNLKKQVNILVIASWFPTPDNPVKGIFIKKHVDVISDTFNVNVVYISDLKNSSNERYKFSEEDNDKYKVFYGGYKAPGIFKGFILDIIKHYRYLICAKKIYEEKIKNNFLPNIVFVNVAMPAGIFALYLKIRYKFPYIISEHYSGYTKERGKFRNKNIIMKTIQRYIFRKSEAIISTSKYLENSLKDNKIRNKNYFIVSNILDLKVEKIKKKYNERIKFLHISNLKDDVKNVSGIIKAFSIVNCELNSELHIVGDGKDRKALEKLSSELLLLNKSVFFHGYIPNNSISEYYQNSDVFVINSNYETFSIVSAEALLYGLPVISSMCGGTEDYLNDDVGILVKKNDIKELSEKMMFIVKNIEKYSPEMIHKYAKKQFDNNKVKDNLVEIINGIIK